MVCAVCAMETYDIYFVLAPAAASSWQRGRGLGGLLFRARRAKCSPLIVCVSADGFTFLPGQGFVEPASSGQLWSGPQRAKFSHQ